MNQEKVLNLLRERLHQVENGRVDGVELTKETQAVLTNWFQEIHSLLSPKKHQRQRSDPIFLSAKGVSSSSRSFLPSSASSPLLSEIIQRSEKIQTPPASPSRKKNHISNLIEKNFGTGRQIVEKVHFAIQNHVHHLAELRKLISKTRSAFHQELKTLSDQCLWDLISLQRSHVIQKILSFEIQQRIVHRAIAVLAQVPEDVTQALDIHDHERLRYWDKMDPLQLCIADPFIVLLKRQFQACEMKARHFGQLYQDEKKQIRNYDANWTETVLKRVLLETTTLFPEEKSDSAFSSHLSANTTEENQQLFSTIILDIRTPHGLAIHRFCNMLRQNPVPPDRPLTPVAKTTPRIHSTTSGSKPSARFPLGNFSPPFVCSPLPSVPSRTAKPLSSSSFQPQDITTFLKGLVGDICKQYSIKNDDDMEKVKLLLWRLLYDQDVVVLSMANTIGQCALVSDAHFRAVVSSDFSASTLTWLCSFVHNSSTADSVADGQLPDDLFHRAIDTLEEIGLTNSPLDMLLIINQALSTLFVDAKIYFAHPLDADATFPMTVALLAHSFLPNIYQHILYIQQACREELENNGRLAYIFTSFCAAAEYINAQETGRNAELNTLHLNVAPVSCSTILSSDLDSEDSQPSSPSPQNSSISNKALDPTENKPSQPSELLAWKPKAHQNPVEPKCLRF